MRRAQRADSEEDVYETEVLLSGLSNPSALATYEEALDEAVRRQEEVKHLPPDQKADRVNELLGLGVVLALLLPVAGAGQQPSGFDYVPAGDTVVGPAFVTDSATMQRLAERLEQARADSIARAALERDTTILVETGSTVRERLDLCGQRVASYQDVAEARQAVVEALEADRPGFFEKVFGQSWTPFVLGALTGSAATTAVCTAN